MVLDDVTPAAAVAIESEHPGFCFARSPDGSVSSWGAYPVVGTGTVHGNFRFVFRVFHSRAHLSVYVKDAATLDPYLDAHCQNVPTDPTADDLIGIFRTLCTLLDQAVDVRAGRPEASSSFV